MDPEQFLRVEAALRASAEQVIAREARAGEETGERTLLHLSRAAAVAVPGAAYVGMTMRSPEGALLALAPSHDAIVELDRLQAVLGEGPCVDALTPGGEAVVRVDDFAAESRWPRFAAAARDTGVGSLLSYALAPHGAAPGAMNFYGAAPGAFAEPGARTVAGVFAMQAAIAVHAANRIAHLNHALDTRDVIGQAKGILMERFRLDDEQAFERLRRSSQETNIKLADVARWVNNDTVRRVTAGDDPAAPDATRTDPGGDP